MGNVFLYKQQCYVSSTCPSTTVGRRRIVKTPKTPRSLQMHQSQCTISNTTAKHPILIPKKNAVTPFAFTQPILPTQPNQTNNPNRIFSTILPPTPLIRPNSPKLATRPPSASSPISKSQRQLAIASARFAPTPFSSLI
jgi:hypothetical protein